MPSPSCETLPYEIISEILSPLLKVPDELFSNNKAVSPFAQYAKPSTSAYLVVCKKWLHAATPLLYNIVVLRSLAQAEALAKVLAVHNGLGNHIRKLRVEGGYGDAMLTILGSAPNLTDLFLSLEIWSGNSTDGLCQGLPLVNPTRLIIHEGNTMRKSKMVTNLIDAVGTAITDSWDKLTSFSSPYFWEPQFHWQSRAARLFEPLAQAGRLRTVTVLHDDGLDWVYPLIKTCPLESVGVQLKQIIRGPRKDQTLERLIANYERLNPQSLPQPNTEGNSLRPTLNPLFSPMKHAPEDVQDAIWSRILHFALEVKEHAWVEGNVARPPLLPVSRLQLLCVCKRFLRLGRPLYYANISFIQTQSSLYKLYKLLSDTDTPIEVQTIHSAYYRRAWFAWEIFEKLLDRSGAALRDCDVHVDAAIEPLQDENLPPGPLALTLNLNLYARTRILRSIDAREMLSKLPNLRRLQWSCKTEFRIPDDEDVGELPKLEHLWIRVTDPTFLDVLAAARLPSLTKLHATTNTVNYGPFLSAHGASLTELGVSVTILDEMWCVRGSESQRLSALCPNLVELVVTWPENSRAAPPRNGFLPVEWCADTPALSRSRRARTSSASTPDQATSKFTRLTKITLLARWFPLANKKLAAWGDYLLKFDPSESPVLEELHVQALQWPTKERDIEHSLFVRAAESLLERGIHLAGDKGVRWRPRLRRLS
ncbi:hypothetical protein C8F01DRAFT_1180815 [Mycena amicta]|nr:hypothetical protein C8F01DRAFT_1180815 [Mycena amicta]